VIQTCASGGAGLRQCAGVRVKTVDGPCADPFDLPGAAAPAGDITSLEVRDAAGRHVGSHQVLAARSATRSCAIRERCT
jgi:hypothetical protein